MLAAEIYGGWVYPLACKAVDGEPWLTCIREWQTIIAGLLALAGAAATVFYLRRQIHDARRVYDAQFGIATNREAKDQLGRMAEIIHHFMYFSEQVANDLAAGYYDDAAAEVIRYEDSIDFVPGLRILRMEARAELSRLLGRLKSREERKSVTAVEVREVAQRAFEDMRARQWKESRFYARRMAHFTGAKIEDLMPRDQ